MREIVDYETGEVKMVEDENEIVEKKLMEIGVITEQTADFIEEYLTMKQQWEIFRHILEKAMRENGIKSWQNDYFTATALDRQEARDEAIGVLKLVAEDASASEEAKAEASQKISKIAVDIQNEANIETLVKAKGFEDCVAIISDNAVSVIVSAESLQAAEAAQILSIVYETTGISPEKVSIINKA